MMPLMTGGAVLGAVLAFVGQATARSVQMPEEFNDVKVISSILVKPQVADCLAKFDVASIDSVKRLVYKGSEATEYTFEGTVVYLDIARGRKTLTIIVEKKVDHTGPFNAYTCSVR